jgi:hypothetical protein
MRAREAREKENACSRGGRKGGDTIHPETREEEETRFGFVLPLASSGLLAVALPLALPLPCCHPVALPCPCPALPQETETETETEERGEGIEYDTFSSSFPCFVFRRLPCHIGHCRDRE